ncbi:MAG: hypothetical protein ABJ004_02970 [Cyclobacteriaceae bacterium]
MQLKIYVAVLLCAVFSQINAQENWTSGRPDGHAPISVMGDHTHGKGDWMVSYRYMMMGMDGLRDGSEDISSDDAFDQGYMMVPKSMTMNMHMLGVMYAPSDRLTLMIMSNYVELNMDMAMRMNGMTSRFETSSSGLGDLKISGLYKLLDVKGQRIHANLGLSVPVGSIDNEDVTPMSDPNATQLPYPMQIGSGTWDVIPGITYMGQKGALSWGAQTMGTIRIGENNRSYAFGNKGCLLGWVGFKTTEWLSFSAKVKGSVSGKISGADPAYTNPMMSPTLQTENFGGTTASSGLGFNIYIPNGALKNVRIGVEYELPLYQNLNGPQMKTTGIGTLGLQYSW